MFRERPPHDMDSQLTLVSPGLSELAPPPSNASTILDFKRDVITSTTITVRGVPETQIHYKVERGTAGIGGMNIRLTISENDRVLATVRRRDMFPDQITFGEGATMKLSRWMTWPKSEPFPATFKENDTVYSWKPLGLGGIALCKGTTPDAPEIAWFHPSYRSHTQVQYAAFLALTPEADAMRTKVLISCVLAVQRMRARGRHQDAVKDISQGMMIGAITLGPNPMAGV